MVIYMAIKTYKKGSSQKLSENFSVKEFGCKGKSCCFTVKIDAKLVEFLQEIREHFKAPVTINSAYRCTKHNKSVGGASSSRHVKGQAADIVVEGVKPAEVAKYAESIGVLGIGLYETAKDGYFVHIDTRTTKSFWYGQAQAKRTTFGGTVSKGNAKVKEWQKAAIADGFKLTANGVWDEKCEAIAKKAVCKKPLIKGLYKNKNLTKFLQKQMGYKGSKVDGKFWTQTEKDLKTHQKALGFVGKDVDGIAGYKTWKKELGV